MTGRESEPGQQAIRPRAGALVAINLADEAAKLGQAGAVHDRQSMSLVKNGPLNVLLIALKKDAELSEHRTRGPIAVHVLSGVIRFNAEGQEVTLSSGCMLALDREVAHSVTALENSSVLLTTAIA